MKAKHLPIVLLVLLVASCQSVEKMIDTGNFDAAVVKSAKKLQGKKKLKTKYVVALEEAFVKATQRDMNEVKRLARSERSESWASILDIYSRIDRRQTEISPLLPIVSKDGHHAKFQFVKVDALVDQALKKYSALLKSEAIVLIDDARLGDKVAARRAHAHLDRYLAIEPNDQEMKRLQNEALALGMVRVRVGVDNFTGHLIPGTLHQELMAQGLPNSQWIEYTSDERSTVDFEVVVVLEQIQISPERLRENVQIRTKEVEDGTQYVIDANGNVAKDSLGNDLTVPRFKEIEARFITVEQFKSALIAGQVVCRNMWTNQAEYLPIRSEIIFDELSANFRGDRRALLKEDKNILGNGVLPFPSDEAMFVDALSRISPIMRDKIKASVFL